jgi:hypothetical protein
MAFPITLLTECPHLRPRPNAKPLAARLYLCTRRTDQRFNGGGGSVVLDIASSALRARADTGSTVQSVLFPAPDFGRDFYPCSFTTVSRLSVISC